MWGFRWGMFKTFATESEKYEKGLDYDARQVRLAIAHARQDISGLCYLMDLTVTLLVLLNILVAAHVYHHW
jgi:hypothetical protein